MNGTTLNSTCYITEKEVARITSRALQTLRNDRHRGRGIPYSKIGASVRYSVHDVLEFMEGHKIQTSDLGLME